VFGSVYAAFRDLQHIQARPACAMVVPKEDTRCESFSAVCFSPSCCMPHYTIRRRTGSASTKRMSAVTLRIAERGSICFGDASSIAAVFAPWLSTQSCAAIRSLPTEMVRLTVFEPLSAR
jgi:hypothetical protein